MDESPQSSRLIADGMKAIFRRHESRVPVIDGIRAIAILWVVLVHVVFFHFGTFETEVLSILNGGFTKWIGQGAYGVDMFFVISGYLIGSLLLREIQKTGGIQLSRFYARRFLRLTPVYIVVMLMGVYFLRNVPKSAILMDIPPSGNIEQAWANLLYVNNFITVNKQYMPWCWSLAIEEQFYIVVPLLLIWLVGKTSSPIRWMILLLILSGLIRFAIIFSNDFHPPFLEAPDEPLWSARFDRVYDKAYTRYAGLLAGVLGAYLSLFHTSSTEHFFASKRNANLVGAVGLAVFFWTAFTSLNDAWVSNLPKICQQMLYSHRRDLFSIALLGVLLVGVHGRGVIAVTLRKILGAKFWFPIAQLSYSMYLLHEMFMLWGFPKTTPWLEAKLQLSVYQILWINGIGVTLLTILGALLLFVFVERPCMQMRDASWFKRVVEREEASND